MEIRRRMGRKGQLVIPKIIREFLGVGPGDEVIMEVRGKEVLIKPKIDPVKFVEDFCSSEGKKLTEKIDLERILEGEVEERLVLR
ncbi:MAG: AbrB/MazE/SpoVT family DNA-binding domain-containing protein [Candidatus Bathyarchaeia archaeon]